MSAPGDVMADVRFPGYPHKIFYSIVFWISIEMGAFHVRRRFFAMELKNDPVDEFPFNFSIL